MKRSACLIVALLALLAAGPVAAQTGADRRPSPSNRPNRSQERKQPVRLSKLFERQVELTPEVKERAANAVAAVAEDPQAMEAIENAANALIKASGAAPASSSSSPVKLVATNLDTDNLLSKVDAEKMLAQGAKLLESSLPESKAGEVDLGKLAPAVSAAAPGLQEMAAPVLEKVMADNPQLKRAAADAKKQASTVRLLPAGVQVPAPIDPLPNRIPRPDVDVSVKPTRITAGRAEFDAKTNIVKFEDNVELDHIDFRLTCDVLTAELSHPDKAAQVGNGGLAGNPQAAAARVAAGGLKKATAFGYVVIEKLTPEGSQVAKSRKTVYDATTQIVTLSEYPVLDDGKNLVRGKEAGTHIILSPDGKYKVEGPATFELVTADNQLPKPGRKP